MSKFAVPIIYRGVSNYIVEAESLEEAQQIAVDRFKYALQPDLLGDEWEEVDHIGHVEKLTEDDDESEA